MTTKRKRDATGDKYYKKSKKRQSSDNTIRVPARYYYCLRRIRFREDTVRIGTSRNTYVVGRIEHRPHEHYEYVLKLFAMTESSEKYPTPDLLVPVSKRNVTFFPWISTKPTGGATKILSPQPPDNRIVANFIMALAIMDSTRTDFKLSAFYARMVEPIIGAHVAEDCGILTGDGAGKVALYTEVEMDKIIKNCHRVTEGELLAQVESLEDQTKRLNEIRKLFIKELKKFDLNREVEAKQRSKKHCYVYSLVEQKKIHVDRIFKELKR